MKIQLGDKLKDTISGIEGIAVGRTVWIHGCERITIQPVAKDNVVPDPITFDEPQLEIIERKKGKKTVKKKKTGGPLSVNLQKPSIF